MFSRFTPGTFQASCLGECLDNLKGYWCIFNSTATETAAWDAYGRIKTSHRWGTTNGENHIAISQDVLPAGYAG
jgi:hypothetical protein